MSAGHPLGPYRLIAQLGRGGSGDVWSAFHQERSHELLAVKRILLSARMDRQRLPQWVEEARLAPSLRHPNIVRTMEVGLTGEERTTSHYLYVVMERLRGRTLPKLEGRPLPVPVPLVAALGVQALRALHHAHREARDSAGRPLHVLHRDLRASNLFLTDEGVLKVLDFGLARFRPGPAPAASDERGDLLSLALVLLELLTGSRGLDFAGTVRPWRPDVPRALDEALAWGLERESAARPGSAEAWAQVLEESLPPEQRWAMADVARWLEGQRQLRRHTPPQRRPTHANALAIAVEDQELGSVRVKIDSAAAEPVSLEVLMSEESTPPGGIELVGELETEGDLPRPSAPPTSGDLWGRTRLVWTLGRRWMAVGALAGALTAGAWAILR